MVKHSLYTNKYKYNKGYTNIIIEENFLHQSLIDR